jgi:hypothetical protein
MSDKPWMKFYPRDWRGDQALRVVSLAARGLWMEFLCIMHEAKPYGHLLINGKPIGDDALAVVVGATADQISKAILELREAGVLSTTRNGIIFSRRMIKDDAASKKGAKAVAKRWGYHIENKENSTSPNKYPNRDPNTQKPYSRDREKEEIGKPISIAQALLSDRSDLSPIAPSPQTLDPPHPDASIGNYSDAPKPTKPKRTTTTDHPMFAEFWSEAYPKRAGTPGSRSDTSKRFSEIVQSGVPPGEILAGARRFARERAHFGKIGTESIKQAFNWLRPQDRYWELSYDIPPGPTRPSGATGPPGAPHRQSSSGNDMLDAIARRQQRTGSGSRQTTELDQATFTIDADLDRRSGGISVQNAVDTANWRDDRPRVGQNVRDAGQERQRDRDGYPVGNLARGFAERR